MSDHHLVVSTIFERPSCDSKSDGEDNGEGFKGCRWSPDGTCVLTSRGQALEVFEVTESDEIGDEKSKNTHVLTKAVYTSESEAVYDYCWYPSMDSSRPTTCCFASVSKGSPVHLWDAYESRKIRASYSLDTVDELPGWALSIGMSDRTLIAGMKDAVNIYEIERPGAPVQRVKYRHNMISGLVSCIDFNSRTPTMALGSYSGQVAVMSTSNPTKMVFSAKLGKGSGVTQVSFSPCGNKLFVGARRSHQLACYDVRYKGKDPLLQIPRACSSNQRLRFGLASDPSTGGDLVLSGESSTTSLLIWNCLLDVQLKNDFMSDSVINGVDVSTKTDIVALSTGTRLVDKYDETELPECEEIKASPSSKRTRQMIGNDSALLLAMLNR